MRKSVVAFAIGAAIGLAGAAAAVRSDGEVAAQTMRGVVAGVILGSRVQPYDWNAPVAEYRSRLQLWSSLCDWHSCDGYGLATVAAGNQRDLDAP